MGVLELDYLDHVDESRELEVGLLVARKSRESSESKKKKKEKDSDVTCDGQSCDC